MMLELTIDEIAVLRDLLDSHLRDIGSEIRHTDNPAFREQLRARQATMRGLSERMAQADQALSVG